MNTGEQLREMQRAFAYPLEDRIKQLESRNAALVAALDHIMKMQLRGYIVLGERATTQAQAALSQQEATP